MEEDGLRPADPGADDVRRCPWCATPASLEATTCASCGAALAQRESIGDLAIAGLTAVDAALQDFDKRPLHLRGPSLSQGIAPALIVGAIGGGPIGIAAIGGVAAVAAAEYLGAKRDHDGPDLESVGRPSEVILQALEHEPTSGPPTAPRDEASEDGDAVAGGDSTASDDGRSIWRDLPPVATEDVEEGSP